MKNFTKFKIGITTFFLICLCLTYNSYAGSQNYRITLEPNTTVEANSEELLVKKEAGSGQQFSIKPTVVLDAAPDTFVSFLASSTNVNNPDIKSEEILVSNLFMEDEFGSYTTQAPEEELYYMTLKYSASPTNTINMSVTYTP